MNKLETEYQKYIYISRYAKWIDSKKRRETWEETIDRYFTFFKEYLLENNKYSIPEEDSNKIKQAILNLEVMPSMRCLMTAGKALKKDNIAAYNCAFISIDKARAFDEILYILMNGTGVGFSVERQYINKLPIIPDNLFDTDTTIIVPDSKLGWAKSFKELINLLYSGSIPRWDLSRIRPAGSILKTFGGRASGPEPLNMLFKFTVNKFKESTGRKLTSVECHDIICKIAEIVIVGGVRRSALISLSNLSDDRMRAAKNGSWWEIEPQRALANNSAVYTEKPDIGIFMKEWLSLYESKSGERGIFNIAAAKRKAAENERRDPDRIQGSNPCNEIIMRSRSFCNLSEVVIRPTDTYSILCEKVKIATILGTWQATLTNFRFILKEWFNNCEDERLLGVSLTGIYDHPILNGTSIEFNKYGFSQASLSEILTDLKQVAIDVNLDYSKKLGINQAAAITCIKPSGSVSQLVNSASGIHPRFSPYYIRRVRADTKDPLTDFMLKIGIPNEPDKQNPNNITIFSFPIKSVDTALCNKDINAIEHLNLWYIYNKYWTEHKPSVTVSLKEDEWLEVASWVYKNFNEISGISFLPYTGHIYEQMPYEECSQMEYEELKKQIPDKIDWEQLANIEKSDNTTSTKEMACSAGVCEI